MSAQEAAPIYLTDRQYRAGKQEPGPFGESAGQHVVLADDYEQVRRMTATGPSLRNEWIVRSSKAPIVSSTKPSMLRCPSAPYGRRCEFP